MGAMKPLETLIDETRLLFHRLGAVADETHREDGISAGKRGVLFSLERLGPSTVPALARLRPVSRQHIQMLVNPLAAEGRIELTDNPAHARSKLVRLTRDGRTLVRRMRRREEAVLSRLSRRLSKERLETAIAVLRELRGLLEEEDPR